MKMRMVIGLACVSVCLAAQSEDAVYDMLGMALIHEKGLAEGLGLLMPGPDRYVQDRGLLPLPQPASGGFSQDFLDLLAPAERHGFTVWPVSLIIDDSSGTTCFYDADGHIFGGVAINQGTYTSNWIARLWYGENSPLLEPMNPLLLPSKVETRWTFVAPSNMTAYAAASLNATYTNAPPGGASSNTLFQVPGVRVADFKVNGGSFSFGMLESDLAQFPHPMFHVLFCPDLSARNWRVVKREFVPAAPPGGTASFALPHGTVFGEGHNPFDLPIQHAPGCVPVLHYAESPIGKAWGLSPPFLNYRRESCSCPHAAPAAGGAQGFFALVSDVDSAGCGVPDWWLNAHGVNPANVLDTVPGTFGMNYIDLFISGQDPLAPPPFPTGGTLDLLFYTFSDYSSWVVTVTGLGPLDRRVLSLPANAINYSSSRTLTLYRGNTYKVTMRWVDSKNTGEYWYCWGTTVDGWPGGRTYNDYSSARLSGAFTHHSGDGYIINNAGGLLTAHVHMRDSEGGNVASGKAAHIYVLDEDEEPLEIGFRKADGTLTDALAVSKWEDAFYLDGWNAKLKTSNFINFDPDRFQVYVKDRKQAGPTITCEFYNLTTSPFGPAFSTVLYRQPDGVYLSTNFIFIADAADANKQALQDAGSQSGVERDQMLQGAFGDKMKAVYFYDGPTTSISATATVGRDVKTLLVDIAVMKDTSGNPYFWGYRVQEDMKVLKERFMQANINAVWNNEYDDYFFDPPPSVVTNMAGWVMDEIRTNQLFLTEASKDIINAAKPLPRSNLLLVYVPSLRDHVTNRVIRGAAIIKGSYAHSEDTNYLDCAFISAGIGTQFTPAHELVHLFGCDHSFDPWNLMFGSTSTTNKPTSTKRLTQEQIDGYIRNSKYVK